MCPGAYLPWAGRLRWRTAFFLWYRWPRRRSLCSFVQGGDVFRIEEERLAERNRAEEALRKARDELEVRVKERTAKLAQTTEQLRLELTEYPVFIDEMPR
jgi:C4-dicarboxylate-specific signal transduction histidine kinase